MPMSLGFKQLEAWVLFSDFSHTAMSYVPGIELSQENTERDPPG